MSIEKQVDPGRRGLLVATCVAGGVAGVATGAAFVSTFQPSERAKAGGSPVEADISSQENKLQELERLLGDGDLYRDGDRVKDTTRAFEETKAQLKQLYEHWEEAVELN